MTKLRPPYCVSSTDTLTPAEQVEQLTQELQAATLNLRIAIFRWRILTADLREARERAEAAAVWGCE